MYRVEMMFPLTNSVEIMAVLAAGSMTSIRLEMPIQLFQALKIHIEVGKLDHVVDICSGLLDKASVY